RLTRVSSAATSSGWCENRRGQAHHYVEPTVTVGQRLAIGSMISPRANRTRRQPLFLSYGNVPVTDHYALKVKLRTKICSRPIGAMAGYALSLYYLKLYYESTMTTDAGVTPGCCEIRRQLGEQFAIAARLYAESAAGLVRNERLSDTQYRRLCDITMQAQVRSEIARGAFHEHVDLHGCWYELQRSRSEAESTEMQVDNAAGTRS